MHIKGVFFVFILFAPFFSNVGMKKTEKIVLNGIYKDSVNTCYDFSLIGNRCRISGVKYKYTYNNGVLILDDIKYNREDEVKSKIEILKQTDEEIVFKTLNLSETFFKGEIIKLKRVNSCDDNI